jgi:hypothetical protein
MKRSDIAQVISRRLDGSICAIDAQANIVEHVKGCRLGTALACPAGFTCACPERKEICENCDPCTCQEVALAERGRDSVRRRHEHRQEVSREFENLLGKSEDVDRAISEIVRERTAPMTWGDTHMERGTRIHEAIARQFVPVDYAALEMQVLAAMGVDSASLFDVKTATSFVWPPLVTVEDGLEPLTSPEKRRAYYGLIEGEDAKPTRETCSACSGTGGSTAGLCRPCRGSGSVPRYVYKSAL